MSRYSRGPPPDTSNMVSLKVDNLTYRTSSDDIEYLFEKYGKIGDVFIPKDKFTRESRGFAFVRLYYQLSIVTNLPLTDQIYSLSIITTSALKLLNYHHHSCKIFKMKTDLMTSHPGSTTSEMPKMQWTLWTDECTTEGT